MKHLGDITKINGYEVPIVDCCTGGSPCQDLSVAGLRNGIRHSDLGDDDTTRSGLFLEQVRILKEMRNAERERRADPTRSDEPIGHLRYSIWENVYGVFSSPGKDRIGQDFKCVLEYFANISGQGVSIPMPKGNKWKPSGCIIGDGWSIAWRTFNSAYWGVPQNRRRVCVLCDFDGYTAPDILFEKVEYGGVTSDADREPSINGFGELSESYLQHITDSGYWNIEPSRKERKEPTENVTGCIGASSEPIVYKREFGGRTTDNGVSPTIEQNMGTGGNNQPILAYTLQDREGKAGGGKGALITEDKATTLRTNNYQTIFQPVGVDIYNLKLSGDKVCPLTASENSSTGSSPKVITKTDEMVILENTQNHGCIKEDGICPTLVARMGTGGNNVPMVSMKEDTQCYRKQGHPRSSEDGQGWEEADKSDTLNVFDNTEKRTPNLIVDKTYAIDMGGGKSSVDIKEDKSPTLCTTHYGEPAVCYCIGNGQLHDAMSPLKEQSKTLNCMSDPMKICIKTDGLDCYNTKLTGDKSQTITCSATDSHHVPCVVNTYQDKIGSLCEDDWKGTNNQYVNANKCVVQTDEKYRYVVRRLTPNECELLQGFPNNYTNIGDWKDSKGKLHKGNTSSNRYKALGNSIALPSWYWIMERMKKYLPERPTLASLFDGIGGFPLIWETIYGKGTCLWASEIEEFPIAVTEKRINGKELL